MTNIPPPFSPDELKEACDKLFAETDQAYSNLGSILADHAKSEYTEVDSSLYIPETIVMVDDGIEALGKYAPHIIAATRGEFRIVFHSDQYAQPYLEEEFSSFLVDRHEHDIICMDGRLDGHIHGDKIIHLLKQKREAIRCIGFSSSDNQNKHLVNAGALGAVAKRATPFRSVKELATLVNRLSGNT